MVSLRALSQLYQWQQRYVDVAKTALNGRGETKDEELARLNREVSVLRKEREILKGSILRFSFGETDR